jgi:hypothetical protein
MQLAGTHGADHRAGHVGAPEPADPRRWQSAQPAGTAAPVGAPSAADERCRARRRPEGPARGGPAQERGASPGTRRAPSGPGPSAPRPRSPWCPDRRHHHLGTLPAEHVVEAAAELRVPIAEQEPHPAPLFAEHQQQVAGCWVTQAPSGLAVTPAKWTRRVSSSTKNSTYSRRSQIVSTVKQVACHDPGRLPAQERPPRGGYSPRCRVEPMAAQRRADRGRRHLHAKPQELTLDPLVTPARILPGQPDDQLLQLLIKRRVVPVCGAGRSTHWRPDAGANPAASRASRGSTTSALGAGRS